jgi:hypothetical protein
MNDYYRMIATSVMNDINEELIDPDRQNRIAFGDYHNNLSIRKQTSTRITVCNKHKQILY